MERDFSAIRLGYCDVRRQEVAQRLEEIKELRRQAIESRRNGAVDQLNKVANEQIAVLPAKSLVDSSTPLTDGFGTIGARRFSRCFSVTHKA